MSQVRHPNGICIFFSNLVSEIKTVTKVHSGWTGGDRLHLLMRGAPKNLQICFKTSTGFHRPLAESLGQNSESFTKPQISSLWFLFCCGRRILPCLRAPALELECLPGLASAHTLTKLETLNKFRCFSFPIS